MMAGQQRTRRVYRESSRGRRIATCPEITQSTTRAATVQGCPEIQGDETLTMPMPFLERIRNKDFPRVEYVKNMLATMKTQNELAQALNNEEQVTVAAAIIKRDYKKGDRK